MGPSPLPADFVAPPLVMALAASRSVLVAGAGGGADVLCGLPIALALRRAGRDVHLANLSFTEIAATDARRLSPDLALIDHDTVGRPPYRLECHLAQWLHARGQPSEVHWLANTGVAPLRSAYEQIVRDRRIDAVVLVDGGTDILMRGDEAGLGTPVEDMASLAAVATLDVPVKVVSCLGFGIDAHHGVCHAQFLENVAALESAGGFLGAHSIHARSPDVAAYRNAVEYIEARMPGMESRVNGSIASALDGRFGDIERTQAGRGTLSFVNPLLAMYWHFDLLAVAERSLYLSRLAATRSRADVAQAIEEFRDSVSPRPRTSLPM